MVYELNTLPNFFIKIRSSIYHTEIVNVRMAQDFLVKT